MEALVTMFGNQYNNRRVLVTGHTGFKGSWLTLWLKSLGAQVTGIALSPEIKPSHWDLLSLDVTSFNIDIRDVDGVRKAVNDAAPEIVFHLAAQPLVRRSYRAPLETWSTNVMGTANLLDACRDQPSVEAIVAITTDKCYENQEWVWGYRETDRLGGHDPYSASKAGSELVAASYRNAFFHTPDSPLLATARAGNVIGGGDWSRDRLIPDLARAARDGNPLKIRSPTSTRPWQHVLDCLSGYLTLGQKLLEHEPAFASAWNFGPDLEGNRQVQQVLEQLQQSWHGFEWLTGQQSELHEARLLHLDSSKARDMLSWRPVWTFEEGVATTAEWYKAWLSHQEIISVQQLNRYIDSAREQNLAWADTKPR
jgi:CDP-glucose 4,6-dehydratase